MSLTHTHTDTRAQMYTRSPLPKWPPALGGLFNFKAPFHLSDEWIWVVSLADEAQTCFHQPNKRHRRAGGSALILPARRRSCE